MLTDQPFSRSMLLTLAVVTVASAGLSGRTPHVIAMHQHNPMTFSMPTPPSDPGAPTGRREGGSSRGDKIYTLCKTVEEAANKQCATSRLTALVPEVDAEKQIWGLTGADHPEFLFYLSKFRTPEQPKTTRLNIEFVLQDEDDKYVHKTSFVLPLTEGGIIRIPIPENRDPLQVGKRYTWTLLTKFGPNETNYVHGRIYRKQMDSQRQQELKTASPLKRLEISLKEGLWFDAIAMLVDLKQDAPQDLTILSRWNSLLDDINLKELATEPMLSCCTPDPHLSLK
ncbi:DUF928 domain-containing protein [Acaryochloris sp. CCMEE 5410]|uniref:DUF928 domain-containing protein n=1 Tax=Acaryochloris sp. CCMEE 5410 TaxID=310037 RepID=UPI0002483C9B|nr:DUF928 domain-containing protein [Acaryochloris sp. CCMEE 5410]KAI9134631.1 DUF928 domain-containing protein [Acaryochloris sp. CCMEE 5410]